MLLFFALFKKFMPECIVIHSTISPGTTERLQKHLPVPVIYSAIRGVHKRMLSDIKRYTKFFAIENSAKNKKLAAKSFSLLMKKSGVKTNCYPDQNGEKCNKNVFTSA